MNFARVGVVKDNRINSLKYFAETTSRYKSTKNLITHTHTQTTVIQTGRCSALVAFLFLAVFTITMYNTHNFLVLPFQNKKGSTVQQIYNYNF